MMDRVRTNIAATTALLFCSLGSAWAQDSEVRRVYNLAPFAAGLEAKGMAFEWTLRDGAPALFSAFGENGRFEAIGLDCVRPNDERAPCAAFEFRFRRRIANEDHAQHVVNVWDASQSWADAYLNAEDNVAVLEAGIRMNTGVTTKHLSMLWSRFINDVAPLFDEELDVAS